MEYVRWFEELGRESVPIAGGKGANLAEMARAGLPVPPGFVVCVDAFSRFVREAGLLARIPERLAHLDVEDTLALETAARDIEGWIESTAVPPDVEAAVSTAYAELSRRAGEDASFVAVRSSGTVEDAADTSFAGMFRSYLNVRGTQQLLTTLRQCWASLFTSRGIAYRTRAGITDMPSVGVVVQRMINAEKSGVIFTIDPATGNRDHIVIEAAFGLGELVVQGDVRPDRYVVDKRNLRILERAINHKDAMLVRSTSGGDNERVALDDSRATARVLADDEVRRLAELAVKDEVHYGSPQDAEFAVEGEAMFLVQTRPITAVAQPPAKQAGLPGEVLVRGLGAGAGAGSGPVRVLHDPREGFRFQAGEVLVAEMTSPDWVPLMRRAAAIVTDGGGMTSHAAIVSRELGVPCIVGTGQGTRILHDGDVVTVDAREGVVRSGAPPVAQPVAARGEAPAIPLSAPVTATRLYVNLGEPDQARRVAALSVDGVGLLRAEFMILSALDGTHPRALLQAGKGGEFVDRMAADLRQFASAFTPRPVIYRSMDFRSNEFRGLAGGEQFEPDEANPMIGYRGCFRNMSEPDLFGLELQAIKRVRTEFSNLHLMIPFVRTRWEFAACAELVHDSGLTRRRGFQLWVMAEVPSVAYWIPAYAELGATGVSIGSNDLTQLVLGVDRDSEALSSLYDERDPAVLDTIQRIISTAHQYGLTCSICGQAPSVHADYAERLVRWGIDSISVTADAIDQTRRNIAAAEQRILLDRARTDADRHIGPGSAPTAPPSLPDPQRTNGHDASASAAAYAVRGNLPARRGNALESGRP